jgi:hypothetical protein
VGFCEFVKKTIFASINSLYDEIDDDFTHEASR